MNILTIQQRFIDAGFQYLEHIFNDGKANCYIKFSRCQSPHHFDDCSSKDCVYRKNDVGWGRFSREEAWRMAAEWLDTWEKKRDEYLAGCDDTFYI